MTNLFEPYVTTKAKGTGLGLAVVKKIIEEHGGMIWADNLSEGGGRVAFRLPAMASNSTIADNSSAENENRDIVSNQKERNSK
jgi:signal transduction histidine kinase